MKSDRQSGLPGFDPQFPFAYDSVGTADDVDQEFVVEHCFDSCYPVRRETQTG